MIWDCPEQGRSGQEEHFLRVPSCRRTPGKSTATDSLFAELTPARLDLLGTLRRVGPCSVYALAKSADRNYSNVHTDVSRLEEPGLVERSDDGSVSVPFESVEIRVSLAHVA